jgi:hypothetical protein
MALLIVEGMFFLLCRKNKHTLAFSAIFLLA